MLHRTSERPIIYIRVYRNVYELGIQLLSMYKYHPNRSFNTHEFFMNATAM